jgi:hydrogenase expression/formation protein HypC
MPFARIRSLACVSRRYEVDAVCLAIPGRILSVLGNDSLSRIGRVDFGGVVKEVSLAFVPDAQAGDYVVIHVGYALTKIDPAEARRTLALLAEAGAVTLAAS